jgi:hypothetical protein
MEGEVHDGDRDNLTHDRKPAELDELSHILEAGGVGEDRGASACAWAHARFPARRATAGR